MSSVDSRGITRYLHTWQTGRSLQRSCVGCHGWAFRM